MRKYLILLMCMLLISFTSAGWVCEFDYKGKHFSHSYDNFENYSYSKNWFELKNRDNLICQEVWEEEIKATTIIAHDYLYASKGYVSTSPTVDQLMLQNFKTNLNGDIDKASYPSVFLTNGNLRLGVIIDFVIKSLQRIENNQKKIMEELDISTDGKLTASGGLDLPYMLYDNETRLSVIERIRKEIPPNKANGIVEFYNSVTNRKEFIKPSTCQIFANKIDKDGYLAFALVQTISDGKPCYNTNIEKSYRWDSYTGTVKETQRTIYAKYPQPKNIEVNKTTGSINIKQ